MSIMVRRWSHLLAIPCLFLTVMLVQVCVIPKRVTSGRAHDIYVSVASHNHVRTQVGLFDVGHMVQS